MNIHMHIQVVSWDGALWFWSVIKTIMTDWLHIQERVCELEVQGMFLEAQRLAQRTIKTWLINMCTHTHTRTYICIYRSVCVNSKIRVCFSRRRDWPSARYVDVYVCLCLCLCLYVCMYVSVYVRRDWPSARYVDVYVCLCLYVCVCVCAQGLAQRKVCGCACMYVHMHVYVYG